MYSQITRFPVGPSAATLQEAAAMHHEDHCDRVFQSLAREIGQASNMLQAGDPVPYDDWPREQASLALWAARYAVRLLERRARHDALLHATAALARKRYSVTNLRMLSSHQLGQCYYDAKVVLDEFWGRMTDYSFRYLDGDTRQRLQQAAKE